MKERLFASICVAAAIALCGGQHAVADNHAPVVSNGTGAIGLVHDWYQFGANLTGLGPCPPSDTFFASVGQCSAYKVTAGPAIDFNEDDMVNCADLDASADCITGPETPYERDVQSPCAAADIDANGSVDLHDVARFQAEFEPS